MLRKSENTILKNIMLVFVTIALICQVISPIMAVADQKSNNEVTSEKFYKDKKVNQSFEKMNDLANVSNEVKDSKMIEQIKKLVGTGISDGEILLNNSNADLEFQNANLLNIVEAGQQYTSLTIPVSGKNYSLISNLTVVYDTNNELISYSETLITKSSSDKFIISSYIDGNLIEKNETDIEYIDNTEIQKGLDGLKADSQEIQARGLGEIAGCIAAVAGVNGVVAYLIAGTCIASCPVIVPICVACIGAVATIGAADIGAVVSCFKL